MEGVMKKGCWNDSEVIDLFSQVEMQKGNNRPLKEAFKAHAEKYRRKPNSVRNYYYYELELLQKDNVKTQRLGIDLKLHEKLEIDYFSQKEEEALVKQIDKMVQEGMSIRKACFNLSKGDLNLMLRYQNKYRNYLAKNNKVKTLPNNVIEFTAKKKSGLTENDINSLFLGLVRLVKRTAIDEYSKQVRVERENANEALRKALIGLNSKDKELGRLKEEFSKLKLENSRLMQKMMKMKCEKAENLTKMKKEENLF